MIKNEREYRITRAQADRFRRSVESIESRQSRTQQDNIHLAALQGQLTELERSLLEYERVKSGRVRDLRANTIRDLPTLLIQARIARGLTQSQLADLIGVTPQQIQRDEAADYQTASIRRIARIAEALNLDTQATITLATPPVNSKRLRDRLTKAGVPWKDLAKRLVGTTVPLADGANRNLAAAVPQVAQLERISRIFGWSAGEIAGESELRVPDSLLAGARFSLPKKRQTSKILAVSAYSKFLATIALAAIRGREHRTLEADPSAISRHLHSRSKPVSFADVIDFVWSQGVVVIPLRISGAFHGAHWRISGRDVVILKQQTDSVDRWIHDLLHEYYHATQEPGQPERSVVEVQEPSQSLELEEEVEANRFAHAVTLGGNAAALAQECATRANGDVRSLKRIVPQVAQEYEVPVGALANYVAFRLQNQNNINWWGTARQLQTTMVDPAHTLRDRFFGNVDLSVLSAEDRELLLSALTNEE